MDRGQGFSIYRPSEHWKCLKGKMGDDGVSKLLEALRKGGNVLALLPPIPAVLDDVEEWGGDARKYLKSLLNTEEIKWPSWDTNATANAGVPGKYPVKLRVCWLANQMKVKSIDDVALASRGISIYFNPSAAELHNEIRRQDWFHDQDILDFTAAHLPWITQPDARNYVHAKEIKDAGLDWQKYLYQQWFADEALIGVLKLLQDPAYPTNKQRAAEFARRKLGCNRTFYNKVKELGGVNGAKSIALLHTPAAVCKSASQIALPAPTANGDGRGKEVAGKFEYKPHFFSFLMVLLGGPFPRQAW